MNKGIITAVSCLVFLLFSCNTPQKEEVNVYTHRHYEVDQEIFNQFTEETGIEVNVINASADELIQRMEAEGANSPADLLITVDAGRLNRATAKGLLQPAPSEFLNGLVPVQYRSPEGYWYGMTVRARIIAYSKDRVDPAEIKNYEDLADPKWKGRLLVRSSDNVYNQSLISSLVAANGEEQTMAWATGLVSNLAREPKGGDRDQIKAIAAKEGDVTIVNTYYVGQLLNSEQEEERKVGEAVGIIFPNQDNRGTHVNISGFGIAKYAKNKENAEKLAEFLLSESVQEKLTQANFEYPINPNVEMADLLQSWGDFEKDTLNLSLLSEYHTEALRIADQAGWD